MKLFGNYLAGIVWGILIALFLAFIIPKIL